MKKNLLVLFVLFTFVFQSAAIAQTAARQNSPARKAAQSITAEQLKEYLYFVASDEMEGRNTPSRGLDLTARFMGMMLARWKFKPAGDNGTFYQKMALVRNQIDPQQTQAAVGSRRLVYGTDFLADATAGKINAPLVFGGNGWFVKSANLDPLATTDVRGKVVVVYSSNFPRGMNFPQLSASGKRGEDWADPQTYAKQKGAAGLIIVSTPNILAGWENFRRFREAGNYSVDKMHERPETLPTVYLSENAAEALFEGETMSFAAVRETYT